MYSFVARVRELVILTTFLKKLLVLEPYGDNYLSMLKLRTNGGHLLKCLCLLKKLCMVAYTFVEWNDDLWNEGDENRDLLL
jgi:hypothetical protein